MLGADFLINFILPPWKGLPAGGPFFVYVENHSLGEWFHRRLGPMMKTEKLLLL